MLIEGTTGFFKFIAELVSKNFMPHAFCLSSKPGLLLLHVLSDALIALAYFAIPFTLGWILYRRRAALALIGGSSPTSAIPFLGTRQWMLFMAFIFFCGLTHVFNIVVMWWPYYYLEGLMKLATAGISVSAAFNLSRIAEGMIVHDDRGALQNANSELIAANELMRDELNRRQGTDV